MTGILYPSGLDLERASRKSMRAAGTTVAARLRMIGPASHVLGERSAGAGHLVLVELHGALVARDLRSAGGERLGGRLGRRCQGRPKQAGREHDAGLSREGLGVDLHWSILLVREARTGTMVGDDLGPRMIASCASMKRAERARGRWCL